ncbi:MAG: M20/M25/M40 family metallo-hydrolase, partial [Oscillospiraceae bacterium]
MLTQDREKAVIELCQKLIQQKSYSGEEGKVADELREFFTANGFDEITVDGYGNIVGKIKGKRPGKTLLFDGHMDTVPVTDPAAWTYNPFAAEIHDGKIYGRGTSDMKGALAAMAVAAANFAKDNDKDFAGEICVAGVVHEECFEGIGARKI